MKTQNELDQNMLIVRGALFNHKRHLERLHDIGKYPFTYVFDDPAIARAHDCVEMHLQIMQGEYFRKQWDKAQDEGLI